MTQTATTILAEYATLRSEVDAGIISDILAQAESDLAEAPPETRMAASQRVRDVIALQSQLAR